MKAYKAIAERACPICGELPLSLSVGEFVNGGGFRASERYTCGLARTRLYLKVRHGPGFSWGTWEYNTPCKQSTKVALELMAERRGTKDDG